MVCNFDISQGNANDALELNDVIYGDVWICSGQSNMEFNMGGIFDGANEIAMTAEYPNIRMFKLKHIMSDEPQNDLLDEDFTTWAKSNETTLVRRFSAVCLLTARYMADVLGKDKVHIWFPHFFHQEN